MQNKTTDNSDANSATPAILATSRQMKVFKIYPLDSRPIAESQSWISVVQVLNEVRKRILLRYGLHHRFISVTAALSLLSGTNRKDLSAFLKEADAQDKAIPSPSNPLLSSQLKKVQQDAVRHTVDRIIQQNIIRSIRQQYLRQQRLSAATNLPQFCNESAVNNVQAEALQNEVLTDTPLETHTENIIYSTLDHHHVFYASAESEIAIEALLNTVRLHCVESIKVSGTENFRRLVWLQAAALGMHIEGYAHTEADRRALFMRTDISAHANIRSSYMPAKAFQKTVMKAITGKNPLMELSATERDYLLQRVRQNIVDSGQQHQAEASA
jgi:hypothetical protein